MTAHDDEKQVERRIRWGRTKKKHTNFIRRQLLKHFIRFHLHFPLFFFLVLKERKRIRLRSINFIDCRFFFFFLLITDTENNNVVQTRRPECSNATYSIQRHATSSKQRVQPNHPPRSRATTGHIGSSWGQYSHHYFYIQKCHHSKQEGAPTPTPSHPSFPVAHHHEQRDIDDIQAAAATKIITN